MLKIALEILTVPSEVIANYNHSQRHRWLGYYYVPLIIPFLVAHVGCLP